MRCCLSVWSFNTTNCSFTFPHIPSEIFFFSSETPADLVLFYLLFYSSLTFFLIPLLVGMTTAALELRPAEPPQRFTFPAAIKRLFLILARSLALSHPLSLSSNQQLFFFSLFFQGGSHFKPELFCEQKELCGIVSDLCTQRRQTQTDTAPRLFFSFSFFLSSSPRRRVACF